MAFATQEDIGNRALQHCGARRITSFSQASTNRNAAEVAFAYDKLRVAELRRSVWRFATQRAVLRLLTPTSVRFVPALYNGAVGYLAGQIVRDATGVYWICLIPGTGNTPGVPNAGFPPFWKQYFGTVYADAYSASTTYYAGDVVYLGSTFYLCVSNTVVNQSPAVTGASSPWIGQPTVTEIGLILLSPAGPGITVGSAKTPRNIFPLPNGFLRLAAPDPKFASSSVFATTGAIKSFDWMLEGTVLISASTQPIFPFRFVADLSDVTAMDALFCEALGARIGYEVCETLTQSAEKKRDIGNAYAKFMADARMVNQIEIGSTEADEEMMQPVPQQGGAQQAPAGAPAQA